MIRSCDRQAVLFVFVGTLLLVGCGPQSGTKADSAGQAVPNDAQVDAALKKTGDYLAQIDAEYAAASAEGKQYADFYLFESKAFRAAKELMKDAEVTPAIVVSFTELETAVAAIQNRVGSIPVAGEAKDLYRKGRQIKESWLYYHNRNDPDTPKPVDELLTTIDEGQAAYDAGMAQRAIELLGPALEKMAEISKKGQDVAWERRTLLHNGNLVRERHIPSPDYPGLAMFREGNAAYREGRFEEALDLWKASQPELKRLRPIVEPALESHVEAYIKMNPYNQLVSPGSTNDLLKDARAVFEEGKRYLLEGNTDKAKAAFDACVAMADEPLKPLEPLFTLLFEYQDVLESYQSEYKNQKLKAQLPQYTVAQELEEQCKQRLADGDLPGAIQALGQAVDSVKLATEKITQIAANQEVAEHTYHLAIRNLPVEFRSELIQIKQELFQAEALFLDGKADQSQAGFSTVVDALAAILETHPMLGWEFQHMPDGLARDKQKGIYVWLPPEGPPIPMVYVKPNLSIPHNPGTDLSQTPFYVGQYETTVGNYLAFCVSTHADSTEWDGLNPLMAAAAVNWNEATAFCEWSGLHLPSSGEWVQMGLAETDDGPSIAPYPWGYLTPTNRCVYGVDSAAPVGGREPGAALCGAEDLVGNLWEWLSDIHPNPKTKTTEWPELAAPPRLIAGGCWKMAGKDMKLSRYDPAMPDLRDNGIGFRVILPGVGGQP